MTVDGRSRPDGIFVRALGDAFEDLAPALRRFHSLAGEHGFRGEVSTLAPGTWLARLCAWIARTPSAHDRAPFDFELSASPGHQIWIRCFADRRMRSVLTGDTVRGVAAILERVPLARFQFTPSVREGALHLELAGFRVIGIAVPRFGWPRVRAVERQEGEDRVGFDVEAALPLIGRVAAYRGWIAVPGDDGIDK
ncbi:hypothetical protein BH10PSE17_BH10PSE17_26990 [soil metagenome]